MKTIITDRAMKAMKPAAPGTRKMIWDATVPSFGVRVSDKGKLTFIIMRRLRGKLVRRMLGQYPIMTLASARTAALDALRDIECGIDPKEKQGAARLAEARKKADSFASVAEEFIARHVAKLRSASEVGAAIRRELIRRWGPRPITDISRRDIVQLLEEIADSGRLHSAHKTFNYLSRFFNWAIGRGLYGLESSPCAGIKTSELVGRREPRQRVLNGAEIRTLWQATEGLGYPAEPFVSLLLLSGQRLREVAEAKWQEFDLDKALWVIPPERMKGDAAHEVPLAPDAVAILQSLPHWTGPFVFSTTDGRRPISGFSKMKKRVDAAMPATIAPWRFHDLRRSMRTGLSALRIPDTVSELCIAHTQKGLHKVYDQHAYLDEKRHAFEAWANHVLAICEPGKSGNVVPLVARR